jgi:hypothetical protein
MGETIEEFCTKTREQQKQKSPGDLPYLQDCEEKYSTDFNSAYKRYAAAAEQRARVEKERAERAQREEKEQREAAIANEKRRAAIAASGVSPEETIEISGEMYRAYLSGGITEMLSLEKSYWKKLARQRNPSDDRAVLCTIMTLAGAFVEASYARHEMRRMMPPCNGGTLRQHVLDNLAKAKISDERADHIIELARVHQEIIVAGLMYAGLR